MSFFKKLFGGKGSSQERKPMDSFEYNGFKITPAPQQEGQQYRLAGTISKEFDGVEKSHMLIRADMFSSQESAVEATFQKARYVIDQQGDFLFD